MAERQSNFESLKSSQLRGFTTVLLYFILFISFSHSLSRLICCHEMFVSSLAAYDFNFDECLCVSEYMYEWDGSAFKKKFLAKSIHFILFLNIFFFQIDCTHIKIKIHIIELCD